jgi:sterol desaturase/sphingolipid hydroxylase (fatty acid hydroxylase superfamily)
MFELFSDTKESLLFIVTTPLYFLFIGIEMFLSAQYRNERYSLEDTKENLFLMIANIGVDIIMRITGLGILMICYEHKIFSVENVWLYWLLCLVFQDFAFWLMHYIDHSVRLFWAVHVTHHSSEKFNLTVGLRSSLLEPLYRFLYFTPIAFLGFKPADILLLFSITQLYGIFIHTQYVGKLGVLEKWFATPSNHRVHHGKNIKYLDRNMGMFLIIWDKLFGTYQEEEEEVQYGLTTPLQERDLGNVMFHEFKSIWKDHKHAPDLKSKWMYVFGPPGWSHDGKSKTSKQLREELTKGSSPTPNHISTSRPVSPEHQPLQS